MAALCYSGLQIGTAGTEPNPKVFRVSDFTFASDVVAIDRGYTARLERKVGTYPTHEHRQHMTERVNDEIVATVVASLREVGLEAQPGAEDAVTLNQSALVVSGGAASERAGHGQEQEQLRLWGGAGARGRGRQCLSAVLGKQTPGADFRCRTNGIQARARGAPKVAAARNAEIAGIVASTSARTSGYPPT